MVFKLINGTYQSIHEVDIPVDGNPAALEVKYVEGNTIIGPLASPTDEVM
jgi:hypothetical protein